MKAYMIAYRDCYRWAMRFAPLQWLWSAFPLPGSRAYQTCSRLRSGV